MKRHGRRAKRAPGAASLRHGLTREVATREVATREVATREAATGELVTRDVPLPSLVGYRVVRVLGSGNRAEVLLAHDENLVPVALKVFRSEIAADDIDRELAALSTHSGRHVLAVRDVATTADGRCVAVLSRLAGPGLSGLMRERGATWQLGELLTVLVPVVAAIAAAHDAGFAHGAITARAIMFTEAGAPVLIGFGHTLRCGSATGESGAEARTARRSDYEQLGELFTQLSAQLAPGEDFDSEVFEEWFAHHLNHTPFEPFAAELERALFELAVPIPVITDAACVYTAPGLARVSVPGALHARSLGAVWSVANALAYMPEGLSSLLNGVGGTVAERLRAIRSRIPSRKPLLVAASLMALLLAAILLLPANTTPTAVAESSLASEGFAPSGLVEQIVETPGTTVGDIAALDSATREAASSSDPVLAFAALIEIRASCVTRLDSDCLAAVVQEGSGLLAADAAQIESAVASGGSVIPLPRQVSDVTLSERSGDAAIMVYWTSGDGAATNNPASALMIRTEAGWRLRELFEPQGPAREGD